VDVKRVTDEAHFTDDLGADWLDRLELMIEIEAQFPTMEFTDDDVDQIDVVGDLIRHSKAREERKVTTRLSRRRYPSTTAPCSCAGRRGPVLINPQIAAARSLPTVQFRAPVRFDKGVIGLRGTGPTPTCGME
jgi:acyl carrier protein